MKKIDLCEGDGARVLKEKIKTYWAESGHNVDVTLKEAPFVPAMRSARDDVRSDMINGLPRDEYERRKKAWAAAKEQRPKDFA